MSVVCESFHCTPTEALLQPWELVQAVLDYRNAEEAVRLMNDGKDGARTLAKNPTLAQALLYMTRAGNGELVERRDSGGTDEQAELASAMELLRTAPAEDDDEDAQE